MSDAIHWLILVRDFVVSLGIGPTGKVITIFAIFEAFLLYRCGQTLAKRSERIEVITERLLALLSSQLNKQ